MKKIQYTQNSRLIAASVLSADFTRLGDEIRQVEKSGADWIHFDVTDGHFVQNLTMGTLAVEAAGSVTSLPLDVHLMIENPEKFIKMFAEAGADFISVHYEAARHLNRVIQLIRDAGVRPGIALGPATPISHLEWILEYVDYVLILSVNPGFGGQSYIPNSMSRIEKVRQMADRSGRDILIQADGGINLSTIEAFASAGVNVFTVGSALFGSSNYTETIETMRTRMTV